ncbi:hypothetical protein P4H29_25960 [Paenibacillus macquariensis]|nr:VOC family protein [Paenibacillus macquariensis]MEC0093871.1 hypothetical protein [Paenibacillus macquariensis]
MANTLGIRHIAIAVEDIEAVVANLKKKGTKIFSETQHYEDSYKLCYCHGPEGIILELAERIRYVNLLNDTYIYVYMTVSNN